MSRYRMIRLGGVCLIALLVLGSFSLAFAQTPNAAPAGGQISLPADLAKDYQIVEARGMRFAGADGDYLVVGYGAKVFNPDPASAIKSFLAIYQQSASGFGEVYRYLPVAAESADYAMPLSFEEMWPITTFGTNGPETTVLLTAWGETGANYFGTHPIGLAYDNGAFKAVTLYQGKLADNPKIKGFQWTSPDFQVTNQFDGKNAVDTILTQGISVQAGNAVLSFYADNECHACEHKIVTIEIPLAK